MASPARPRSRAAPASSNRRSAAGASLAPRARSSSRPTDSGRRRCGRDRLAVTGAGLAAERGSSIHWSCSSLAGARDDRRACESDCSRRAGSGPRTACAAPRRATLPHDRRGSGGLGTPDGAPREPGPPRLPGRRPPLPGGGLAEPPGGLRRGPGLVDAPSVQASSADARGLRRGPSSPALRRGGRPPGTGPKVPRSSVAPGAARGTEPLTGGPPNLVDPPGRGDERRREPATASRSRPPLDGGRPRREPGSPSGRGRRGGLAAITAAYRTRPVPNAKMAAPEGRPSS